jgi:hypothetical protein
MAAAPANNVPIILIALVGWRLVSRIRRSVGRQVVTAWRMALRVGIYVLLTLCLTGGLLVVGGSLPVFGALFGGLVGGALLGLFGLHLTTFEATPAGSFYTPNPYMGTAVSILLVARIAYRYIALSNAATVLPPSQPQFVFSPLTMLLYGILAGYYIAYFLGVFLRTRAK